MKFDKTDLYYVNLGFQGKRLNLFEIAKWKNGLAFKNIEFADSGVPIIKIAELNNGINSKTSYTKNKYSDEVYLKNGDLIFSWSGNPETSIDIFKFNMSEGWLNQHIFKVTPNDSLVEKNFFYFLMKYLKPYFKKIASNKQTTGLGYVTISDLKRMSLNLPPLDTQKKIAAVLSALDDKIELNNAINKNLEEQAQAIYKSWFIDFEPFGGTMPDDWRQGRVEEIVVFHDSKRIPLSANERKKMKKIYPYYGATSIIDYVEDYIFNGIFLLFAEDGTVIDDKGFPILQYVEGKFWVNNHAHILTGQLGFSVETLYLLFKTMNINSIITGAVQQKVSQSNLKRVPVVIASYKDLIEFDKIISPMFEMIRGLRTENQKLGELRDALLPKLMSGEIDVSEVEI